MTADWHEVLMREALAEAALAEAAGDVPVGCVVALDETGEIVGRGRNRREIDGDPTAHAEVVAIRAAAAALGSWRLTGCTLAVTLEPCAMCAGAIVLGRVPTVVYGAADPKAGAAGAAGGVMDVLGHAALNHRPRVVGGVLGEECGGVLRAFFRGRRALGKK